MVGSKQQQQHAREFQWQVESRRIQVEGLVRDEDEERDEPQDHELLHDALADDGKNCWPAPRARLQDVEDVLHQQRQSHHEAGRDGHVHGVVLHTRAQPEDGGVCAPRRVAPAASHRLVGTSFTWLCHP